MSQQIHYHDVSRETWERHQALIEQTRSLLEQYLEQLSWWNRKVNLVSRNAETGLIWHHISHSLLPLPLDLLPTDEVIFDAGTGGGLPGIPLALAAPDRHFILNDINFKKITAVHQMAEKLQLKNVHTRRGAFNEHLPDQRFTFISKHSFKLDQVLGILQGDLPCSRIILYKGGDFIEEISDPLSSLSIDAHRLDTHQDDPFYDDKFILNIRRSESTEA